MGDQSGNSDPRLADPSQPGASAFGLGTGALLMTVFGFVWLGWGFSVSQAFINFSSGSALPAARWITFYLLTLALLGVSIQSLRKGKALMGPAAGAAEFRSRFSKPFRMIVCLEGAACGVVVALVLALHRLDLLAAGISLVVGVHFIPLARLFRFPAYYAAGAAIIVSNLLSVALLRAEAITLSVGVATGAVLWITAIYALLRCRQFLREVAAH